MNTDSRSHAEPLARVEVSGGERGARLEQTGGAGGGGDPESTALGTFGCGLSVNLSRQLRSEGWGSLLPGTICPMSQPHWETHEDSLTSLSTDCQPAKSVSPRLGFGHLNLLLMLCDRSSET